MSLNTLELHSQLLGHSVKVSLEALSEFLKIVWGADTTVLTGICKSIESGGQVIHLFPQSRDVASVLASVIRILEVMFSKPLLCLVGQFDDTALQLLMTLLKTAWALDYFHDGVNGLAKQLVVVDKVA